MQAVLTAASKSLNDFVTEMLSSDFPLQGNWNAA